MKQKERIEKMEKILFNSSKLLEELEKILDKIEEDSKNYYSKNWTKDKEDFEKDLLPNMESAVVLTEDGIYDMMTASSGTAIHMLELATKILKR